MDYKFSTITRLPTVSNPDLSLLPDDQRAHIFEYLKKISFNRLKKLYQEGFVKSPLFIELIRDLKSTVVEFRFLKQAQIIKDERRSEGNSVQRENELDSLLE